MEVKLNFSREADKKGNGFEGLKNHDSSIILGCCPVYSVKYLQMIPVVDLHQEAVPIPQEESPSNEQCQSLSQLLQLPRMDSELNLQSEIK